MRKFRKSFLVIFLALICAFCLAFGLTACDLETSGTNDNTGNTEQTDGDNDVTETPSGTTDDDTTTPSTGDDTTTPSTGDDTTTPSTGDDTTTPSTGDDTTTPSTGDDTTTPNTGTGDDTGTPSTGDDTSITRDSVDVEKLISLFSSDIGDTTMIIEDVSIVVNEGSGDATIAFDAGEFYLSFVENEGDYLVKAYADGEVKITNVSNETKTYDATFYSDGETAYIMYSGDNDMQLAITVDYDYMTAGASTLEVELLYDADMREMKDMMIYMLLQISPLLSGDQELDPAITKLFEVIAGYSDEAADLTNTMAGYLMTVTTTEDGETVTFDLTAIMQLVKDVYELDVSSLADKYIAEGAFDAVTTYLSSLADKKIVDVVTGLTTEAGIDNETLFAVIDAAVEMVTGAEFDIESILAADGTVESQYAVIQAIANMTVDELLTAYAGTDTATIVAMISSYKNVNLFAKMFPNATEAAQVYSIVNSYLEMIDESILVSATAYTNGGTETTIEYKDFSVATSDIAISANGKITITSGAEIPADAEDVKTANSAYANFATALSTVLTDGKYSIDSNHYLTVDGTTAKYVSGTTEYVISADSGLMILYVEDNSGCYSLFISEVDGLVRREINLVLLPISSGTILNTGTVKYMTELSVDTYTHNADGKLVSMAYDDGDGDVETYTYTYNAYGWLTKETLTYTYNGMTHTDTTTYTYTVISSETVLGCTVYYVAVVEDDNGVTYEYNTYMFDSDISEIYSNYLQLFNQE